MEKVEGFKAVAYKVYRGVAYTLHYDGEFIKRRLGTGAWARVEPLADLPDVR